MTANVKMFLSIFFGVGLGIMVGLELHETISWLLWVAPILVGVFSYMAVDIRGAVRAIPVAFATVKKSVPSRTRFAIYRWRLYASVTITMYAFLLINTLENLTTGSNLFSVPVSLFLSGFLTLLVSINLHIYFFISAYPYKVYGFPDEEEILTKLKSYTVAIFPHRVVFSHLPRGIWYFFTRVVPYVCRVIIPELARNAWRVLTSWFRLIHSNQRIICLAYAFLFAGFGLIIGGPSPLIWMVAGGLLGVVNYQLISVRWLKLVPLNAPED